MRSFTTFLALAAGVSAFTPSGFKPESSLNVITVAFGHTHDTIAVNGTVVDRSSKQFLG
jgi:hypothetical protein